jgi:hypothetical protein
MKRTARTRTAALTTPVFAASTCNLFLVGGSCSFATDTTGGVAQFNNPANLSNIGSGVITPFLTQQRNGSEAGSAPTRRTSSCRWTTSATTPTRSLPSS